MTFDEAVKIVHPTKIKHTKKYEKIMKKKTKRDKQSLHDQIHELGWSVCYECERSSMTKEEIIKILKLIRKSCTTAIGLYKDTSYD